MAISAVSSAASAALQQALGAATAPSVPTPSTGETGKTGFGEMVGNALDTVNGLHNTADSLAIQAATGDLDDVHEYTIAATQAELATSLTVAVRDRAVNAFNEIMRMQL